MLDRGGASGRCRVIDIAQIEPVVASMHGDQRDLVKLLRSGVLLDQSVRNYIADELEKEPAKRFRQARKTDRRVAHEDWVILKQVEFAKYHINVGRGVDIHELITDREALDWLAESGVELDQDRIGNTKKRRKSAKK